MLLMTLPLLLMMAVLPTLSQVHAPGYPGPGTVCLNDRSVVTASSPCQNSGSVPTPFIFNGPYPPTPENSPSKSVLASTSTVQLVWGVSRSFSTLHIAS